MKNHKAESIFICLSLLFCLIRPHMVSAQNTNKNKLNIVLIFMDDMGYGDVEAYGGTEYQTPHIDKLADQGMRFTNFYSAQPICSASRAGLMTGTYPNRIGITMALWPDSKIGLNPKEETIPELLKTKGYATGMVGKWHLGDAKKFLPLQQGFDMYLGLPYSNDQWPKGYRGPGKTNWQDKMPPLPLIDGNKPKMYIRNLDQMSTLTTRYTERADQFITTHKDQPFLLYFAHSMPHVPLAVSNKFKGKSKQGLYGDVMMEIDWSVGQVMKTLKKNGLEDNTLIIFTSDNGPWLNFGNHAGSAGGLAEGKQTTWEGGQREPAIMRWPGVIPAGTVNNKLACTIDLLPTFAKITGARLPSRKIDGVNILPLLKYEKDANPRDHLYYYYHKNDLEAVRQGQWKLMLPHRYKAYEKTLPGQDGRPGPVKFDSTDLALYNMRRDPGERYNVRKQHPEVVKKIMKLVEQAREDLGDDLTGRLGANHRAPGRVDDN